MSIPHSVWYDLAAAGSLLPVSVSECRLIFRDPAMLAALATMVPTPRSPFLAQSPHRSTGQIRSFFQCSNFVLFVRHGALIYPLSPPMDPSRTLLIWVLVASGIIALTLILTVGAVLWLHQRRLADQAKAWGRYLLVAQEEERHRIARDLHDDVVQRLSSAQMRLNPAADQVAVKLLSEVSRDLRILSRELYPSALSSVTLGEALRDLVAHDSLATASTITVQCDDEIALPTAEAVTIFRIAQEALHNMRKHSHATQATLSLARTASGVELKVDDNGIGFVPSEVKARSYGLRNMRERLVLVGGSLEIQSIPNGGTSIVARVPLP